MPPLDLPVLRQTAPLPAPKAGRFAARTSRLPRLGRYLLERGAVHPGDLTKALALRTRQEARLGEILLHNGWVSAPDLMQALSDQHGIGAVDARFPPQDKALITRLPADLCLEAGVVPWARVGDILVLATCNPDRIADIRARLPQDLGMVMFSLASEDDVLKAIAHGHGAGLARRAEAQVAEELSCRNWRRSPMSAALPLLTLALVLAALMAPARTVAALTLVATGVLAINLSFKALALYSHLTQKKGGFATQRTRGAQVQLPKISLMVPLFREPLIAGPLAQRMSRLDYPRELLDVCLIVEETDVETRTALSRARVPSWFRIIVVPDGHPRTKPRAMNYALNFAKGSIIGVYDAEDAPDAAQLHAVAHRFARAPQDMVCLQGQLDFYNPRTNWISRCFTVEYASWFRVILPSILRMGLAMPLGGTTVFFRREALEKLGGWDAHNVTEDADLGVRLARAGYRSEMLEVTTMEEANAATWPWIKQRSRWNKGYFLTWMVHNRHPLRLYRDLGLRRWVGFQVMFLGSLLGALLAPFLWGMSLMVFGVWHPVLDVLPQGGLVAMGVLLVLGPVLTLLISLIACKPAHLRFLRPWAPLVLLYLQLSAVSSLKAMIESVGNPFYWDKTEHGTFGGSDHEVEPERILAVPTDRRKRILGAGMRDAGSNLRAIGATVDASPLTGFDAPPLRADVLSRPDETPRPARI